MKENVKRLLELNYSSQQITTYFAILLLRHWTTVTAHGSTSTKTERIGPISLSWRSRNHFLWDSHIVLSENSYRKDRPIQLMCKTEETLWALNTETSVEMELEAGSISQKYGSCKPREKLSQKHRGVRKPLLNKWVVLFFLWTLHDYFGGYGTSFSEMDLFGRTNSEWKLLIINVELMM